MEYIYTVMLLNKSGKDVNEANVSAVLKAAGVEVDSAKIKSLIAALDGVDIEKVISESSVAVSAAPSSTSSGSDEKTAQKAEEKKKEAAPAVDASAGLGSLF